MNKVLSCHIRVAFTEPTVLTRMLLFSDAWFLTIRSLLTADWQGRGIESINNSLSAIISTDSKISSSGFCATLLSTFNLPRWQKGNDIPHAILCTCVDDGFARCPARPPARRRLKALKSRMDVVECRIGSLSLSIFSCRCSLSSYVWQRGNSRRFHSLTKLGRLKKFSPICQNSSIILL